MSNWAFYIILIDAIKSRFPNYEHNFILSCSTYLDFRFRKVASFRNAASLNLIKTSLEKAISNVTIVHDMAALIVYLINLIVGNFDGKLQYQKITQDIVRCNNLMKSSLVAGMKTNYSWVTSVRESFPKRTDYFRKKKTFKTRKSPKNMFLNTQFFYFIIFVSIFYLNIIFIVTILFFYYKNRLFHYIFYYFIVIIFYA